MRVLNIFLIITILSLKIQSTQLSIGLTPYKSFCFSEDLRTQYNYPARHTLARIDVSSDSLPYRLEIMYLREKLNEFTSEGKMSQSITTQKFGIYRFCLTNMANKYSILVFEFLSGVQARDYASHTQNKDYVSSIENQANIAELFVNQIKEENKQGLEILSQNQEMFKKYSIQYFFSTLFIGLILLLSYFQFTIIKGHMLSRKYI